MVSDGGIISKAFLVDKNITLQAMKSLVIQRFKLETEEMNLQLCHLNLFQKIKVKYSVETYDDLASFMEINDTTQVEWTCPLYVSREYIIYGKKKARENGCTSIVAVNMDEDMFLPMEYELQHKGITRLWIVNLQTR